MSSKQLLFVVIATSITIIIWVIADIVHSRSQVKIPDQVQQLLEPIDPNFDKAGIDGL